MAALTHGNLVALADIITKLSDEIDLRRDARVNLLVAKGGVTLHLLRSEVEAIRRLFELVDDGDPALPVFWDCGGDACQQQGRYCDGCAKRDREQGAPT